MSDYRKYGSSRANQILIEDPYKCFVCSKPIANNEIECPACGFPQNGDEASQRWFLGQLRHNKLTADKEAYRVGYAFKLLLAIPIILLLFAFVMWVNYNQVFVAQITFLIALAFLSIWFWRRRDPYRAFLFSLILYTLVSIPVFIVYPTIILSSRMIVLMPYLFLYLGLKSYKQMKTLDEDLENKNTG
jgi:hypothetical protein